MIIKPKGSGKYLVRRKQTTDQHIVDLKNYPHCDCKGYTRHKICIHLKEVVARIQDGMI